MPTVQANGINIYYEIHGSGEPLMLISGLSYCGWQWHRVIPGLAEHFQVISFDNRGIGQTDAPPGPYNAAMLADDTAGLIKALVDGPVTIVGHSMGGFIAQQLLLSHAELVKKAMLASTNFGGPNHIPITPDAIAILSERIPEPHAYYKNAAPVMFAPGYAEAHPEIIDVFAEYRIANPIDPAAYQAQMAVGLSLINPEDAFEFKLKEVQTEVVIFSGEHDRVVPPGNVALMAKVLPKSKTYIMKDAGHWFMMEVPERTIEAFIDLLGD